MLAYSLLNPVRFRLGSDYEFNHNRNYCYFQKWQKGDTINLQFLSDSTVTIELRSCENKKVLKIFNTITIPSSLIGQDFNVEEVIINTEEMPYYGRFFFQVKSNNMETYFRSEPFEYKEICYNTILLNYRNLTNDFDMIFDTGIELYFRIEGTINNFVPKSDSVIYFNQRRDATLLYGVPYRTFTLYIGHGKGVPDWALDLSNMILNVDQKKIDGFLFEKNEGAGFEVKRIENYALCSGTIEIVQKNNNLGSGFVYDQFVLGDNENNAIVSNNNLNITK